VDDADRLAVAVRAKRVGRQYACRCPAHDDRSPSLTFWQGHTAVRVKCWSGCDPLDVLAAFKALGVWPGKGRGGRSCAPLHPARGLKPRSRGRPQARAGPLDLGADRPGGRDARRALSRIRRGLALEALAEVRAGPPPHRGDPLSSRCPRGSERLPAMVSLMRQVANDRPAGVHRVFLDDHGHKLGKGMMLGPVGQAAVKLAPAGASLVVCEGVETGSRWRSRASAPCGPWAPRGPSSASPRSPASEGCSCGRITTQTASASARPPKPSRPGRRRASKPRPPARQPWGGIMRISSHEDCRNERRRRPPDRARRPAHAGGADRRRAIRAGLRRRARRGYALRPRLRRMARLGRTGWHLAAR
jgi:hypothetical protein